MFDNFFNTWRPDNYHGFGKKRKYFEEWYYKLITKNKDFSLAIIPGVTYSKDGKNSHSFIQFYNGAKLNSTYFKFEVKDFVSEKKDFHVKIKDSIFKKDFIKLDIKENDNKINGELLFEQIKGWPVKLLSPGIMGWYGLVGFMECYYHVLSFKHRINGFININGETIDFDDGWGYIEKNWGTSFPSSWVWIQSNQFNENENSAFMFSVAKIPFLNMKFNGFVGGLLHNNKFYPFATYNGSKIKNISINDNSVNIEIASTKYLLKINAERKNGFYLPYPTNSGMDGKILESLKSNLTIELSEKKSGNLIFKGNSDFTGLEISDRAKNLM